MAHDLSHIGITNPTKVGQFEKKGIDSVEALLNFFPRAYRDFRQATPQTALTVNEFALVYGTVTSKNAGTPAKIKIRDDDGFEMAISFFGALYQFEEVVVGERWYFGGKVTKYGFTYQMSNPTYVGKTAPGILPVYSKISGMSDAYLTASIDKALGFLRVTSSMDDRNMFAARLKLMPEVDAYAQMHHPTDRDKFKAARTRIGYDTIYEFYRQMFSSARFMKDMRSVPMVSRTRMDRFCSALPFRLTTGQAHAIEEIAARALSMKQVNCIVSGDVGCGKTLVAVALSVLMAENALQSIIMAPTLVLARQHYNEFCGRLKDYDIHIALLTGETKTAERRKILGEFAEGKIDILVGTHAVLTPDLKPHNLGMTVVDEEHKFGVKQKETIANLDKNGAHHISMTATPIPRTLALALYGNSVSVIQIQDMPVGRKPVITQQVQSAKVMLDKVYDEVRKGHQAYIVTPFIEESESEVFKRVASVEKVAAAAEKYYGKTHPGVRIASISGNMKQAEIVATVDRFVAGEIDVLISTTIIEVGVNVPNATVIAICNADRFGLASLHQLRGRVGRGSEQAYCYLLSSEYADKLEILCQCNNGFQIAEQDVANRGAGDLLHVDQSGRASEKELQAILKRPKLAAVVKNHFEKQ